ncbi:cache domain-containing protein [Salidesulfovibrio brasiliensis]|uniref:cache domain-containing protein n=1 Tax=Salidesulfovibrio brasiliensis TaxID=221711 RepID=UPI0006CF200A|nr:cache domain-containing protein [Salidesulfovibrio brasiliensis]
MLTGLLRRFSIRTRLALGLSALLAVAVYATAFLVSSAVSNVIASDIHEALRNTTRTFATTVSSMANASVRNRLSAVAEKNLEIVRAIHRRERNGEITEAEAKKLARDVLLSQTIGQTGYLYAIDSGGKVVVHPHKEVVGTDVTDHEFIRTLMKTRRGYLEYDWKNPGDAESMKKVLSATYFAPWDWIITASAYRHEFGDLVSPDDFRPAVNALRLGNSGYVFVVDRNGLPLIHPRDVPSMLGLKDAKGMPFGSRILTERNGSIGYWWRDAPNAEPREKFALFKEVPAMEWIVVATVYTDELYKPLFQIKVLTYGIGTVTLLLMLLLGMAVSRSITQPLSRFMDTVDRAGQGDYGVRVRDAGNDEIGRLSKHFDRFMDQLVASITQLENETEYRKYEPSSAIFSKRSLSTLLKAYALPTPRGPSLPSTRHSRP